MINNNYFYLFIIFIIVFCLGFFFIKKISIKEIIIKYFSIYFGGYVNENEKESHRKISVGYIMFLGVLPYLIGSFGLLAFYDYLCNIDISVTTSLDGMMLSIMAIFFGLNIYSNLIFNKREKDSLDETNSLLFITILLVIIESIISIFIACGISETWNKLLLSVYYAIKVKTIVLFLIALHNVYYINKNKQ